MWFRSAADRRDQWWKRAQWALDLTLADDEDSAEVGYSVLSYLADSKLAGVDEQRLLAAVANVALDSAPDGGETSSPGDEGTGAPR